MIEREQLRARLNLRAVLPLLRAFPFSFPFPIPFPFPLSIVQFSVDDSDLAAHLRIEGRSVDVRPGSHLSPTARLAFRDPHALNRFFAGRPVLPRIDGWRHPLLLAATARLLASLRILAPGSTVQPARRVALVLRMVTRALAELARGGHPAMAALVADSPDRVYQWTVEETGLGGWLRMCRGRVRAGDGEYAHRRPFVRFLFPTVESAFRVFTATGSQMEAVQRGLVRTEGSPEHARAIGRMMQQVDQLLTEA